MFISTNFLEILLRVFRRNSLQPVPKVPRVGSLKELKQMMMTKVNLHIVKKVKSVIAISSRCSQIRRNLDISKTKAIKTTNMATKVNRAWKIWEISMEVGRCHRAEAKEEWYRWQKKMKILEPAWILCSQLLEVKLRNLNDMYLFYIIYNYRIYCCCS